MKLKVDWKKRLGKKQIMNKVLTPETKKFAYNTLFKLCIPYVPMQSGTLFSNVEITQGHLMYKSPYAFFQYCGRLMVGEDSQKAWANYGERKRVVESYLNYSKEQHPLASREWDVAAMKNGGKEALGKAVVDYINR